MSDRRPDDQREDKGVAIVFHENLPPRRRTREQLREELRVLEDDEPDED